MAKRKPLEGKDLMLFLDGKTIALSNSCTLNVSRDMDEASSKDDGVYRTVTPGNISWDITADSLFSPDEAAENDTQVSWIEMLKAQIEGVELEAWFTLVSNPSSAGLPAEGWTPKAGTGVKGKVYVNSNSATGAKGSSGSLSLSFTGNGPLDFPKA